MPYKLLADQIFVLGTDAPPVVRSDNVGSFEVAAGNIAAHKQIVYSVGVVAGSSVDMTHIVIVDNRAGIIGKQSGIGKIFGAGIELFSRIVVNVADKIPHAAVDAVKTRIARAVEGLFGNRSDLIGSGRSLTEISAVEQGVGRKGNAVIGRHIVIVFALTEIVDRQTVAVVVGIHGVCQTDLFELIDAAGTAGAFSGCGKCGQQHRSKDCNNCDNDQKLDEGEIFTHFFLLL